MTATNPQISNGILTWSAPPGLCYLYQDGRLIAATTARSMPLPLTDGEASIIEIFDDPTAQPTAPPNRIEIDWYGNPTAERYLIEHHDGIAWAVEKTLLETGEPYYRHLSPVLADSQTHRYRLHTIFADGSEQIGEEIKISIARYPDPPAPNMTLNLDLTVTIS